MSASAAVLVVDDNVDHGEVVAAILRREGFAVDACFDAQTAIAMAESRSYAAIVLECSPCAAVQPVLGHLATRRAETVRRIVVATTESDEIVLREMQDRGVFRVLRKPLAREVLTSAVLQCCRETSAEG